MIEDDAEVHVGATFKGFEEGCFGAGGDGG